MVEGCRAVIEEARVLQFSHHLHLKASLDPTRNPHPSSLGHSWLWRVVQALFPVPNLRLNSLLSYASEHTRQKQFLTVTKIWIVSSSSAWPFLSSISCTANFLNQFESLGEVSIFLLGPWLYTDVNSIKHNYELLWEMANLTWMCIFFLNSESSCKKLIRGFWCWFLLRFPREEPTPLVLWLATGGDTPVTI